LPKHTVFSDPDALVDDAVSVRVAIWPLIVANIWPPATKRD